MSDVATANLSGSAAELNLLAAALAEAAERRRRTAVTAAGELDAEREAATTTAEQLSAGAMAVVGVLAEAATLDRYAQALAAAVAELAPRPAGPSLEQLTAAGHVPTLAELAQAHNAALGGVNGAQVWTAPGVLDDDDDLDAEEALTMDMQP